MANPKIEVEISSDVEKLRAGFSDAQASIVAFGNKIKELKTKFDSSNGVISTLQNRISQLKKNLEGATDIRSIAQYNIRLKTAQDELARLGQVGLVTQSKLANANQQTSRSFGGLTKSVGNANGVAQEFSRIIQDSPFGIIGIGNNIQQLTANFAQVSQSAGGAGAAIKASLSALISPANLLVLGISAVTAGFTAYQMGAFDFIFANEESEESLKDVKTSSEIYAESLNKLIKSLSAVNSARLESNIDSERELSRIDLLKSAIEDESKSRESRLAAFSTLKNLYPSILGNIDAEKVLINGLSKEYGILTAAIFERASASAIEIEVGKIATERVKLLQKENSETSFQNKLLTDRNSILSKIQSLQKGIGKGFSSEAEQTAINRLKGELEAVNSELETLGTISSNTNNELLKNKSSTDSLKEAYTGLNQELIGSLNPIENVSTSVQKVDESVKELIKTLGVFEQARFNINVDKLIGDQKPILDDYSAGFVPTQETAQVVDPTENLNRISELRAKLEEETPAIQTLIGQLGDAFSSLGGQIANSMNIGNDALKGFVSTLLSSTPKIITAIFQQIAAKKVKAAADLAADQSSAMGGAVVLAVDAAKGLGPVGLALLPIFLGGAMALVSGAFKKGGGGSGGGSVGAGVSGQTFGGSGFSSNAMNLNGEFIVRGTDLVYVLNRVQDKNAKG